VAQNKIPRRHLGDHTTTLSAVIYVLGYFAVVRWRLIAFRPVGQRQIRAAKSKLWFSDKIQNSIFEICFIARRLQWYLR